MYGNLTQEANPQQYVSQITLPNGITLTGQQVQGFNASGPDQQAQVAAALGVSVHDVQSSIYAAQQGWGQGAQQGQVGSPGMGGYRGYVPNAQAQYVASTANTPPGPWQTMPGLFKPADMPTPTVATMTPISPTTPPNAAQARPGGTGVPWATAPMPGATAMPPGNVGMPTPIGGPVPGIFPGGGLQGLPPAAPIAPAGLAEAHSSALADAGKALYAHFGGDPASATHADIADFHGQMQRAIAGGPAPAVKARAGGVIPGTGNTDTVPAMLTPGEYVMNKDAVKEIGLGRLQAMNRKGYQSGGPVAPSEERHQAITADAQAAPPAQDSSQPAAASAETTAAPSTGAPQSPLANLYQQYQQRQAQAALNSQGASGGGYNIPANLGGGYIGASPGPGQSGYWYPNQAAATAAGDVGTGVKGGMSGAQVGNIASTVMSGVQQAMDTYAKSIGSWQMKPYSDPYRRQTQPPPTTTFSQPQGREGY